MALILIAVAVALPEAVARATPAIKQQAARYVDIALALRVASYAPAGLAILALLFIFVAHRTVRSFGKNARANWDSLSRSEQFARATVDALPTQIAILDESSTILAVNRAWREFPPDDAVIQRSAEGTHYLAVCDSATGRQSQEAGHLSAGIRAVIDGREQAVEFESAGHYASGEAWCLCRITPFPTKDRNLFVVSFEDITRRKRAEEAVQKAREAADSASAAKSAFLANMSHEIRTPMTAILGYADLLLEPQQTAPQRQRCARIIRRNGEHLLAIINDVLDISKIEAEKVQVEMIECDLVQLVSDAAALTRMRAIQKSLKFHVVFDGPIPARIKTDPLRARQVLVNMIGNAVKFTERGSVTLRVSCQETVLSSAVQFDVIDTGIGMSDRQLARLFQPFSQGDESTTRKFGGTGLGLNISKRLARLLGGDLVVQSESGVGSSFSVWFDGGSLGGVEMLTKLTEADIEAAEDRTQGQQICLRGKVLVAEDGQDNRELIRTYLEAAGIEVLMAENGRIACDLAASSEFDLILMDMQMPEMDGYSATAELRSRGITKPIIALTANAMGEDRGKCLTAGCDDYLAKPIDRERFYAALARRLPAGEMPATPIKSRLAGSAMEQALQKFVGRLPDRVEELSLLMTRQDMKSLEMAVHKLKGAAGGYGFAEITECAGLAEGTLRENGALESIRGQINALIAMVRQVEGYPKELAAPAPEKKAIDPATAPCAPTATDGARRRIDAASGLANRVHAEDRLPVELSHARRSGQPLSCVLFDLAPAGVTIETLGEAAVGKLLHMVSLLISTSGPQDASVYRIGTGQILLVLSGHDAYAARGVAAQLSMTIAGQLFGFSDRTVRVTCTTAVAAATLHTSSGRSLLEAAEQALAEELNPTPAPSATESAPATETTPAPEFTSAPAPVAA